MRSAPPASNVAETRRFTAGEAAILAVAGLVLLLMRAWAFDLPFETDEANYAVIGGRLLASDRLYVDVWDHQPPGVFMLYAAAIALFGDAPIVFRLMASAASLLTLLFMYLILRRGAGLTAATLGAVTFALASSDPGTAGEGCNREIFMNTLIVAAWWLLCRPGQSSLRRMLACGLMLGAASLLKTIVAVHWLAAVCWLLLQARQQTPVPGSSRLHVFWRQLAALAAGPAVLWILTIGYFLATQRADLFWDAVFGFNVGYSETPEPFLMRFLRAFQPKRHPFIFESARAVWVLGIVSCLLLLRTLRHDREGFHRGLVLLIAASYAALCLPAQFWPHYYYLMLPPLLLAACACIADVVEGARHLNWPPWVLRGMLAVFPAWLGYTEWRDYVHREPLEITAPRYNSRDFWAQAMGWKAASVTEPGDTIFVYGSDAGIYYYSSRRCASRFTMTLALRPEYGGAEQRREWLMEDLRRHRPRLLLVEPEEPFEAWMQFIAEGYEYVGCDTRDDRPEDVILYVFADRARPVRRIEWDWSREQIGQRPAP